MKEIMKRLSLGLDIGSTTVKAVLTDRQTGQIQLNPLYQFVEDKERSSTRHVEGRLVRTSNPMRQTRKLEMAGFPADV